MPGASAQPRAVGRLASIEKVDPSPVMPEDVIGLFEVILGAGQELKLTAQE